MASQYENERNDIRKEFEEGMDELFRIMFNETVMLYLMDEENTQTNVYQETPRKVYKEPVELTAKVVVSREQGNLDVQTTQQAVVITVPNKQLVDKGVPHGEGDLDTLQKALFEYKGYMFLVDTVEPRTQVADTFLFYEFRCTTRDKDDTEYVFPVGDGSG